MFQKENVRLKQEKLELQNVFETDCSSRQESEMLCRKMEVEALERDIVQIKNNTVNIERFKLRPLLRELTVLKQKDENLKWSLKML